ncbi:polyamine aminopropyltransferase [Hydrogenophaga sp. 5NK40-0174]|uniref:polyamine aminopropyltransferase n=1 Tax=Hydrogenophaga sp. 5NK40-0174 TaxID=3127649 RepID=UPI003107B4F9
MADSPGSPALEGRGVDESTGRRSVPKPAELALLAGVFVVAACGLVYELAAAALASYVLGDSVLQFSTVIGSYLFAMGVGSWLSRYFKEQLPTQFLRIELLIALVGGALPAALLLINAYRPEIFQASLYAMVLLIGTLVGLEIPLVMRILRQHLGMRQLVSDVLTYDYLGALAVSIAFPLWLVPQLGLVRTGLLFGFMNLLVAAWTLWLFRAVVLHVRAYWIVWFLTTVAMALGWSQANRFTTLAEDRMFGDTVVLADSTPYQRIVLTNGPWGMRLFLNGNLQFSQQDEYRYHEALVHPVASAFGGDGPKKVAVLGGGDGMAVRELLRYPSVESITLVELDPAMTRLFASDERLVRLNGAALQSPRVKVVNEDAFQWLEEVDEVFDIIVVDFPDPTNFSIGKLYSRSFYALLSHHLSASGYAVVQSTSPLVARESFWSVEATIAAAGLSTRPYHAHVPSFGEWGFIVASHRPFRMPERLPPGLRFLDMAGLPGLFEFPLDMQKVPAKVNRLSDQTLVQTYAREWGAD